jgi:hypothetical protein
MNRIVQTAMGLILAVATTVQAAGAEVAMRFPGGRIAYSADGNQHDKDDIGATAMSIAMLSASGLGDRLVHYDFSCHLGDNNRRMNEDMIESALGGAKRFGLDQKVFFNSQTQLEEAIENFRIQGNRSTAKDPLWYICAGPMEVPWRCVNAVDPEKRKHVHCISHSGWNDKHSDTPQMNHRWQDLGKLEATLHHIRDQNSSNGDNDFNGPHEKWLWLKNSDDPNYQWLYSRNKFGEKFDVSDSGMLYWLITGGPDKGNMRAGWSEAKALLTQPGRRP